MPSTVPIPWMYAVLALIATTPPADAQPADPFAPVGWLAGCWAAEGKDAGSGETWTAPAGGTMLGMSRSVRNGRTVEHEFMRFGVDAEGRLALTALPSGQRETTFVLSAQGPGESTFENAQHDFPQRVIYRLLTGGRMLARIEGLRNGTPRAIDFPMRRIACPTSGGRGAATDPETGQAR